LIYSLSFIWRLYLNYNQLQLDLDFKPVIGFGSHRRFGFEDEKSIENEKLVSTTMKKLAVYFSPSYSEQEGRDNDEDKGPVLYRLRFFHSQTHVNRLYGTGRTRKVVFTDNNKKSHSSPPSQTSKDDIDHESQSCSSDNNDAYYQSSNLPRAFSCPSISGLDKISEATDAEEEEAEHQAQIVSQLPDPYVNSQESGVINPEEEFHSNQKKVLKKVHRRKKAKNSSTPFPLSDTDLNVPSSDNSNLKLRNSETQNTSKDSYNSSIALSIIDADSQLHNNPGVNEVTSLEVFSSQEKIEILEESTLDSDLKEVSIRRRLRRLLSSFRDLSYLRRCWFSFKGEFSHVNFDDFFLIN